MLWCIPPGACLVRGKSKIYVAYAEHTTDMGDVYHEVVLSKTPNLANWSQIRSQIAEGAHLIQCPDFISEDLRVGDDPQARRWAKEGWDAAGWVNVDDVRFRHTEGG